MKKAIALILALAMVFALAACGQQAAAPAEQPAEAPAEQPAEVPAEQPAETPAEQPAEAPVEQILNLSYTVNTLNTYDFKFPWADADLVNNLLWLTLIQADKDLNAAEPEIMDSWSVSPDGLTVTMTMREGLKWSDGEPITMDDVIWTLEEYCTGQGTYWAYVKTALSYVEGFEEYQSGAAEHVSGISADGNVLTFTLKAPFSSFLNIMCQVAPLPKHIYEGCNFEDDAFKADPIWRDVNVNSGMFVVTEHVAGSYFILEPNPYYNGEMPKITKIVCTMTSDNATTAQTGAVDYFVSTSPDDYAVMSENASYTLFPVPVIFYRFFCFNFFDSEGNEKHFIDDVNVRKAFAMAVDWETLIGSLFGDQAILTQTGVLSNSKYYAGNWFSFDPDGAKALLDEANYDYSHALKIFYYYNDQTTIDLMDAITYYLDQIGVKVDAVYTANAGDDIYAGRTQDIAFFGLSAYDSLSWYQMYLRDNMQQMIPAKDIFADAVAELEAASSDEALAASLAKLQAMDSEYLFYLPIYSRNQQVWLNNRVTVPADCFGNSNFFFDYQFESWEIAE